MTTQNIHPTLYSKHLKLLFFSLNIRNSFLSMFTKKHAASILAPYPQYALPIPLVKTFAELTVSPLLKYSHS